DIWLIPCAIVAVVTVTNALDALTILRAESECFDLVVTDVHMLLMNGLELLLHIREEFSLPVFLISSDEDEVTKQKGFDGGASRYILKSEFPYFWEIGAGIGEKNMTEAGNDAVLTWVCEEDSSKIKEIGGQSGEGCSKDVKENKKPHNRPKLCWTPELHRKFENAIYFLGI
ncbi:Two-component response regulator ORR24-like protein, partial [Drosera capensis]